MLMLTPPAIEVSQSYPQMTWWVYEIDQQTITALWLNFQEEQFDDRYTPKQKVYARKPEDVQLPKTLQKKIKHPNPKVLWSTQLWYKSKYMNRRLHQDNTRVR